MKHNFPVPYSKPTEDFTRRLTRDWAWEWMGDRIVIPAGVEYDPSIPSWASSFVPDDFLEPASLPHDVIYKLQGNVDNIIWRDGEPVESVSRKYADKMFYDIMTIQGVPAWRRELAYYIVRLFGGFAWREEDDFEI